MPIRKDPLESGKQRIQEGLTELLELTEPLDAYRDCLRSQIRNLDQSKEVSKHRVASAFSRITRLVQAKEQEMLQHLDELCDDAKSKAGEKLRETASASDDTSKAAEAASDLLKVTDKQAFFSMFSATSQKLQRCLDDLLLFSSDIPVPKEESNTGRMPQLAVIETQATELCQQITDMLASSVTVDTTTASLVSGPLETKKEQTGRREEKASDQCSSLAFPFQPMQSTSAEDTKSSKQLSSPVFTFSPLKSAGSVEEVKSLKQLTSPTFAFSPMSTLPSSVPSIPKTVKAGSQSSSSSQVCSEKIEAVSSLLTPSNYVPPTTKTVQTDSQHSTSIQVLSEAMAMKSSWPTSPDPTSVYSQNLPMSASYPEAYRPQVLHYPGQASFRWMHVTQGCQLQAVVTEAVSPSYFWVHSGGQPLRQLMERLSMHFSMSPPVTPFQPLWCPNVGATCAACFSADRQWYRAKAICIIPPAPGVLVPRVLVLYVDYGNREEVLLTDVRPLDPQFLDMPAQAMLCCLSGVQPAGPDTVMWPNPARSWFVQAIAKQNLLVTVVRPPARDGDPALVELHVVWGANRLSIGNMMINSNMAIPSPTSSTGQAVTASGEGQKQSQSDPVKCWATTANESTSLSNSRDDASREGSAQSGSSEAGLSTPQSSNGHRSQSPPRKIAVAKRRIGSNSTEKSQTKLSEAEGRNRPPLKLSLPSSSRLSLGSPGHQSFASPLVSCEQASDIKVMVSHVQNPGRFYVHIIGEELKQFDNLMLGLKDYYSREVVAPLANPKLNEPCAVMFREHRQWCRAATVGVQSNEVCVNFVDYGNREWVCPSEVYPLPETFLDLPKQAVECTLADIFPHEMTPSGDSASGNESEEIFDEWLAYTVTTDGDKQNCRRKVASIGGTWQKMASELFEKLVGGCKVLFAKVEPCKRVRRKPRSKPSSAASSPVLIKCRGSSGGSPTSPNSFRANGDLDPILHLHLYDTTGDKDVYINQSLVDAKFADSLTLKQTESPTQEGDVCADSPTSTGTASASSLEDVFSDWDPRKAEYESVRNSYQLNPDDTNVALHGYERQEDNRQRGICHYFARGYCRRGNSCHFRHVNNDIEAAFWSENQISLPCTGSWVPVVVTAVTHPHLFWVQLPQGSRDIRCDPEENCEGKNGKKLAELMDNLQKFCSSWSRFDHAVIDVSSGEWVCAHSQRDQRWYRAVVIDGSKADGIVKVFWVDYGDCEYVSQDCLVPMRRDFQHLPFQSVECQLEGVAPTGVEWSQSAREVLQQCTVGKLLCAHVSFRQPDKLFVSLFDTSAEGKDVAVAKLLIDAGVAKPATDSMLFEKGGWMTPG